MASLQSHSNRRFAILLICVAALHALMLLVPVVDRITPEPYSLLTVSVRLEPPLPVDEPPSLEAESTPESRPVEPPPVFTSKPVVQVEVPVPSPGPVEPEILQQANQQPDISARLLSRQFDYQKRAPLFGEVEENSSGRPDYYARRRPGLEEVLNEPSLQLPFSDTRIYLVDSYSPGIGGSVERFFDTITVPFGWTTKHNTRIQCAWVMIIAGCSWGHVSLFHKKAERRKTDARKEY